MGILKTRPKKTYSDICQEYSKTLEEVESLDKGYFLSDERKEYLKQKRLLKRLSKELVRALFP